MLDDSEVEKLNKLKLESPDYPEQETVKGKRLSWLVEVLKDRGNDEMTARAAGIILPIVQNNWYLLNVGAGGMRQGLAGSEYIFAIALANYSGGIKSLTDEYLELARIKRINNGNVTSIRDLRKLTRKLHKNGWKNKTFEVNPSVINSVAKMAMSGTLHPFAARGLDGAVLVEIVEANAKGYKIPSA